MENIDLILKNATPEQCDYLMKQIENRKKQISDVSKYNKMEEKFIQILNSGLIINYKVSYNTTGFYDSNKVPFFVICPNDNIILVMKTAVWSVFESEFGCTHYECRNFFRDMFTKHTQYKGFKINQGITKLECHNQKMKL